MPLNLDQLKQFKGLPLNANTSEAYAKMRLGLGDDWCACTWSFLIPRNDASTSFDKAFNAIEEFEHDEDCFDSINNALEELAEELSGSDVVPRQQMWVRLANVPDVKALREAIADELELEYQVCLIDWDLVQQLVA